MNVTRLEIPDVLLIEPTTHSDTRGLFFESYNQKKFQTHIPYPVNFVQDNQSRSVRGVLRGLHYQLPKPQGKLIRVIAGEIFDVVVDIRARSPTFRHWVSLVISSENRKQLWVPGGFAHGFYVSSEMADVAYKTTDYYFPENEHGIIWNDTTIGIDWPVNGLPILSDKDANFSPLELAKIF